MHWKNSHFQNQYFLAGKAHTTWEKYRLLKQQLEDRTAALEASKAGELRLLAKIKKLEHLQLCGTEWEALEAEADLIEAKANLAQAKGCVEAAQDEIWFMEQLVNQLRPELEATRIEGYSDQEMFQHCQAEEWKRELICRAQNYHLANLLGIPADQIGTMRLHPEFETMIAPMIQAMQQPQSAIQNGNCTTAQLPNASL